MTEPSKPKRVIFLDLDDTLYPKSSGIHTCVAQRIAQYLSEELQIENANEKSYELYRTHGTTLRGLIHEGYQIEPLVSFYHYAHSGFSYEGRLTKEDVELKNILKRLRESTTASSVSIYLFTNSDLGHATRVMDYLGIGEMFDGLVAFEHLGLDCKPHVSSFEIAMKMAGVDSLQWRQNEMEIYFFDDNIQNVRAAVELGWTKVVWMNEQQLPNHDNVIHCETFYQLEQVCPELLQ